MDFESEYGKKVQVTCCAKNVAVGYIPNEYKKHIKKVSSKIR